MHLFCSFMIKNKNHNLILLYQNYGSYLAEKERFSRRSRPLVEIVVSGVYAVAPTRYSFSPPISRSLNPPLAAVALEQLLEAKKNPELYRDLRVRVTGYSGIFVDFCERLQDDVIKRFE